MLRLPIYEGSKIKKEYTAEDYTVKFGTAEDIINLLDGEKITQGTDKEMVAALAKSIPKATDTIKFLIKDIFPGITDEEIRDCSVVDVAVVLVGVFKTTVFKIMVESGNSKK